jgi:type II secretory ATPase GspE/PulE/Tfp pilus assembly ATPase PilB-like protein
VKPSVSPQSSETNTVEEILGRSALFKNADPETLKEAAELLKVVQFKSGEPIFLENEVSNFVYIVKTGRAEVLNYDTRLRQLNVVRTLGPGDLFSEMSVLARANHSTSCFAATDMTLFSMDYQCFIGFLFTKPVIAQNLVHVLATLNQKLTLSSSYVEYVKPTDFVFHSSFQKIFPLEYFSTYEAVPLNLDEMSLTVAMVNPYHSEFYKSFNRLNPDMNLRVRVVGRSDFARLSQFISRHYHQTKPGVAEAPPPLDEKTIKPLELSELLVNSPLFTRFSPRLIQKITPYFRPRTFMAGEKVFTAGSKSEYFYLIQSGNISLQKSVGDSGNTQIALLGPRDSFGEISLLLDSKHSLDAIAANPTTAFVVSKKVVTELLKRTEFSVPLAKSLAERLQALNRSLQMRFYPGAIPPVKDLPLNAVPKQVITHYKILPLKISGEELTVGFVNPEEGLIHQVVSRYLSSFKLNLYVIREDDFEKALQEPSLKLVQNAPSKESTVSPNAVSPEISNQNSIEYTSEMIWEAVNRRASDVHIEPYEKYTAVRYRIDGMMTERSERIDKELGNAITNRIKILAAMDVAEKRLPQDGVFTMGDEEREVTARASTVPSVFGEKIVLRLAPKNQTAPPLNMIAPDKSVIAFLRDIAQHHQGVFLITGPTGSGKTTTLYSLLSELNTFEKNIVTVENPVEIIVPGITQISINEKIDLSFGKVLRHILRQDPNVVMIGEVRDKESAQFTFEMALTGHLVLSTLHTNNSLEILPRLRELDVGQALLSTGLLGVMAQRLIPKLCMQCRVKRPCTVEEAAVLKSGAGLVIPPRELWDAKGCTVCAGTGFRGRIPVFEYWKNEGLTRELLLQGASSAQLLQSLRSRGFRSLFTFGLQMAIAGLTTVANVVQFLHGMEYSEDASSQAK